MEVLSGRYELQDRIGHAICTLNSVERGVGEVAEEGGLADRLGGLQLIGDATLRPEKRAEVFVEAVRRGHAQEPRLRGAIVGGGPQLAHVQSLAAEAPDVVRALGERSDVPDLIEAADVVCLTSSFEGLPMTVLEAMALSRPVVAMRVGGIAI